MNIENITSIAASIATAVGVGIAAWQIRESRKLSSASFEDSFDQQYRELSYTIPVNAFLGLELGTEIGGKAISYKAREAVYNYLDLCNEQVYQRSKKRISAERWHEWVSGIEQNLSRPFFAEVWAEVKTAAPRSFSFLEELERHEFKVDPAKIKNT